MLYETMPRLVEQCPDRAWHAVVGEALGSASYKELHDVAMLEHEVAGIATDRLLPDLLAVYDRHKELEQQQKEGRVGEEEAEKEQLKLAVRVRRAVAAAEKEAADAKQILALAPEAGDERAQFLKLALSLPDAARRAAVELAKLYGRLREQAAALQAQQIDRVVLPTGITLGDDLLNQLPAEYAFLDDLDLELLWLSRYVDKSLMVYERQTVSKRKLARGDAVVLVDESGSMSGERVQLAKAFALLVKQTIEQDASRSCHLASFSTEIHPAHDILLWASQQLGGGTSFDMALQYALQVLAERENADLVVVTDGEDNVSPDIAEAILRNKQERGWRLFVVYIDNAPRSLAGLADSEVMLSANALEILT
jgi:uncharacterized protein with von Willebrand factor type A (vWA) domain